MDNVLGLIKNDPWLEPYANAINGRHDFVIRKEKELLYFGLHKTDKGWVLREWAPNATKIVLVGTFSGWEEKAAYQFKSKKNGVWELKMKPDAIKHLDLYKLHVYWDGGMGERIPAWVNRVVQDETTKIFSAQVWCPEHPYKFRKRQFKPKTNPLLIYECHIKELIDEAHRNGLAVIMDIVHSHAVKNEVEGLANFAGDPNQYFYPGDRHEHPAWDSLCFDYGKNEVLHFLLSNCKYWLEEFHFDGFRFDGVTSMIYYNHGLGEAFCNYGDYYNGGQDDNAIAYLTLANKLIHQVKPDAITIAEEVSGMPGLAAPIEDGGYGFDYRMAMNIPDYWIKTIKEKKDEDWQPSSLFWEVTNRRKDEKTISYVESHDQALVGDKTVIFRLIDADMYWHMAKRDRNFTVDRGIALDKMIKLLTVSTINGGYLNFMGNEFGHPEWIDFPREGNGWSYKYARRQWNLVDNHDLCYHYLGDFDKAMLQVVKSVRTFQRTAVTEIWHNDGDQILAYERGQLVFIFNFNPSRSFEDYGFLVKEGKYTVVLNTDDKAYGGFGLTDDTVEHFTMHDDLYHKQRKGWLKLYIPARTAVVLRRGE